VFATANPSVGGSEVIKPNATNQQKFNSNRCRGAWQELWSLISVEVGKTIHHAAQTMKNALSVR
jgi:hypothetical protein